MVLQPAKGRAIYLATVATKASECDSVTRLSAGRGSAAASRGLRDGRGRVLRRGDSRVSTSTGDGNRVAGGLRSAVGNSGRVPAELDLGLSCSAVGRVAVGTVGAHGDRGLPGVVIGVSVDIGGAVRDGRDGRHDGVATVYGRDGVRLCMLCRTSSHHRCVGACRNQRRRLLLLRAGGRCVRRSGRSDRGVGRLLVGGRSHM
jgi:hypothetical protein